MTDIPRLPEQYLDRRVERRAIEGLLDEQGARVAIYGLPGVGKTAMAAKIASDASAPESLGANQVLWADFGQAPDNITVLRDWCQVLGAEVSAVAGTPDEQLGYLRGRLSDACAGKLVLFVLDDVGSSRSDLDTARKCLIEDDNCRYLVTTIGAQTAERFAGSRSFHIEELKDQQAARLLERYARGRLSLARMPESVQARLLRLGGGLPLGLMVLGLFLGDGLRDGGTLTNLLRKLNHAESLLNQDETDARLRPGHGGEATSIDTIFMARWLDLSPEQQEALQTAAVFREKPHTFTEAAWAGILAARRAPAPESSELAESIGQEAAKFPEPADLSDSWAEPESSASDDNDDELKLMTEACERLESLRAGLMQTGLLEQPQTGEPSFTIHSLIVTFLRTSTGLDADGFRKLHINAARYYRGWLTGFQENHAASSPYQAAYRFENRQWMGAMLDLCYHLREAGNEEQALLLLASLFFDAFWWWGELIPYRLCDELLRLWEQTRLGAKADECIKQLGRFKTGYPVIDLDLVPPENPVVLPGGYQDGNQGDFPAVLDAVTVIRSRFIDEGADEDPTVRRDRLRLRMLTGIYLGEAHRVMGEYRQATDSYREVLGLLDQLGQDKEDDDWTIPYIYAELADLNAAANNDEDARDACTQGARSAVGDDGEALEEELGKGDIDHEVLSWLWRAAGDAHWSAGRLAAAWRSYAWACFHTCTAQLWPQRMVSYESDAGPHGIPERREEFGVDDYTVTCYKLQLARMLERLGDLWTAQRRTEACEGVRAIRQALGGGPDPATRSRGEADLDALATTRPEASWEECRDQAWRATGLSGLAQPLVPWERLTGHDDRVDQARVADQRRVAADLAGRLKAIWASSKWTPDNGPGQL